MAQARAAPKPELIAKLKKKFSSRKWRLNNLYMVQDEKGRKVRFRMNAVQDRLDSFMWWLNLVLKSRQHGITTYSCIRGLDMAIFRAGSRVGIIAHTKEDAGKFFRDKVLYAYENLPAEIQAAVPIARLDKSGTVTFSNGSSIEVSVSHRGGTFQFLHISEYGPMCAMFPQRADEVKTGALNTIHEGGIVIIESTAYGRSGDFYKRAIRAMKLDKLIQAGEAVLTRLDYRFFFFAWFDDPKNTLSDEDAANVTFTKEIKQYFDKVAAKLGIKLTRGQKAWYIKKAEDQDDKMTQEHPSTPEEAFEGSQEGIYLANVLSKAAKEGRITDIPIVQSVPVNTFWDIGRNDLTAIWFHQYINLQNRFIGFYENSGEGPEHYARVLNEFAKEHDIIFGDHYLPHDVENTDWSRTDDKNRAEVLEGLGIKPVITVERIEVLGEGIDAMRRMFPTYYFDKTRCKDGIERLWDYRKRWNAQVQAFQDTPVKNDARNAADALRQHAQGFEERPAKKPRKPRKRNWKTL